MWYCQREWIFQICSDEGPAEMQQKKSENFLNYQGIKKVWSRIDSSSILLVKIKFDDLAQ